MNCQIPLRVQDSNFLVPSLRQWTLPSYFSASLCTWHIYIKHHAPSDYQARNVWQFSEGFEISSWALFRFHRSTFLELPAMPANLWRIPTLSEFNMQLKNFLFVQPFPQTYVDQWYTDVTIDYVYVYLGGIICAWMVRASTLILFYFIFCSPEKSAL